MQGRSSLTVACLALAFLTGTVHAEKADRDKPVNIESDRMTAEQPTKTAVFEGGVVLTQGTLTIHASRLVIRQDSDGFQHAVATGNPATFRQKRDGANEYIEGEADRIEYDGKTERIQFFEHAHLHRDSGDDVRGSYISYDMRTEFFTVQSAPGTGTPGQDNRVRAVIMPKNPDGTAGSSRPAQKQGQDAGARRSP
jgi:lipopolysaccharide export system protein LptA